jgi:membrane carboxypeptidase/penicillin-binding protein
MQTFIGDRCVECREIDRPHRLSAKYERIIPQTFAIDLRFHGKITNAIETGFGLGLDTAIQQTDGCEIARILDRSPQGQSPSVMIESVDRAAFYQLKTMLQGVVARGTARAISGLSPYVAGKTGTSDDENDAWFVGFTNDVTVAVWMGYDNADGKRRTLGGGSTGGGVAVPIFEPVIQAVWANVAPRTALAPPSPEAKRQLACKSIDLESGEMQTGGGKAITECLRVDGKGKVVDTQYRLVSQKSAYANRDREDNTPRTKVPSSTQPLGNYHGAYAFDNNGRYVYTPDLRRGVAQPAPPRENYQGQW